MTMSSHDTRDARTPSSQSPARAGTLKDLSSDRNLYIVNAFVIYTVDNHVHTCRHSLWMSFNKLTTSVNVSLRPQVRPRWGSEYQNQNILFKGSDDCIWRILSQGSDDHTQIIPSQGSDDHIWRILSQNLDDCIWIMSSHGSGIFVKTSKTGIMIITFEGFQLGVQKIAFEKFYPWVKKITFEEFHPKIQMIIFEEFSLRV